MKIVAAQTGTSQPPGWFFTRAFRWPAAARGGRPTTKPEWALGICIKVECWTLGP